MPHQSRNSGFTLMELLVVVAIIGMLASVVIANVGSARSQARDAQRQTDMKNIELALELYYDEHNEYPCETASNCSNQSSGANGKLHQGAGVVNLLESEGYMDEVPTDPLAGDGVHYYYYDGAHCNDSNIAGGASAAVIGFNKAEESSDIQRQTTCGGEGNLDNADYNAIIGPSSG